MVSTRLHKLSHVSRGSQKASTPPFSQALYNAFPSNVSKPDTIHSVATSTRKREREREREKKERGGCQGRFFGDVI